MLYRFRSMKYLLGEYNELEKEEIYFASLNELNDPLEGMLQTIWDGDEIAWKGLINNYLLCLEHIFSLYRLGASLEELLDIPVFRTSESLQTERRTNIYEDIRKEFFENTQVNRVIEFFGNRDIVMSQKEVLCFLRYFHIRAVKIVIKVHYENGLISDEEMKNISKQKLEIFKSSDEEKIIGAFIKYRIDNDEQAKVLFDILSSIYEQNILKIQVAFYEKINDMQKKWAYIFMDFTQKYIESLMKLMYPNCFVSCFSQDFSNSSMWGNYADCHKGACLIFDTNGIEGEESIPLCLPYSYNSDGSSYKYTDRKFSRIEYNLKSKPINFFESLGRLNGIQLTQWLVDENKNKSKNYEQIYKNMDKWRKSYWDYFQEANCKKTKDWEYEKESRLYIYDSFFEFKDPKERAIKYKFENLNGIIFGIKTTIEDKIKIVKIIEQKCKKYKREEFNFYQAVYDFEYERIKIEKMTMLS